jgi:Zn-dependent protease with chaperone function
MQFFQRQQSARRLTTMFRVQFLLVLLFGLLVFTVALPLALSPLTKGGTLILLLPFLQLSAGMPLDHKAWDLMLVAFAMAVGVFVGAVLIKRMLLANSHKLLTKKLGCVAVSRKNADAVSRRLLNIVDEMAMASGIAAPAVYVWENSGINAMAIGARIADAKLAISRGCLDHLSRDELQCVVAHEISHILNGDMPLNLRIAAFISALSMTWRLGVLFVTLPAHSKGVADAIKTFLGWIFIILWIGLVLCALGAPHFLGARLLQAAICREREKLADASAVQFTRNPLALKTALMKAELLRGVAARVPSQLADLAHLCFTQARKSSIFDTHPSIEVRLRAIDPRFQMSELEPMRETLTDDMARRKAAQVAKYLEDTDPPRRKRVQGRSLVDMLLGAEATLAAATAITPVQGKRPETIEWLLALLLEDDEIAREAQLQLIERRRGVQSAARVDRYLVPLRTSTRVQRLAELQRLLPELRELAPEDQRMLHGLLFELESLDEQVDVFEYALTRTATIFLADLLTPTLPRESLHKSQVVASLQTLFSVVAQCGHVGDAVKAEKAYRAAMSGLIPGSPPPLLNLHGWAKPLDGALDQLDRLRPTAKQALIRALNRCVQSDGNVSPAEFAMVEAIAAALHCPLTAVPIESAPSA